MSRRPGTLLVTVSVADIHREPAHQAERVTQAILGERLRVLDAADAGRWYRVRLRDGYRGWIRSWLAVPGRCDWPGPRVAEVDEPFAWIRSEPSAGAEAVSDIVIGTRLKALSAGGPGWLRVALPDGRTGFVSRSCLLRGTARAADGSRRPATAAAVLATARRFLGVPYVWGGRSPKGLDCSGFVQMTLDLHGITIPRDSRDQRAFFERRPAVADPRAVPPGGLMFFGRPAGPATHVGFSLGRGLLLHAQGRVRIQSIVPDKSIHNKELSCLFQTGHLPRYSAGS